MKTNRGIAVIFFRADDYTVVMEKSRMKKIQRRATKFVSHIVA